MQEEHFRRVPLRLVDNADHRKRTYTLSGAQQQPPPPCSTKIGTIQNLRGGLVVVTQEDGYRVGDGDGGGAAVETVMVDAIKSACSNGSLQPRPRPPLKHSIPASPSLSLYWLLSRLPLDFASMVDKLKGSIANISTLHSRSVSDSTSTSSSSI